MSQRCVMFHLHKEVENEAILSSGGRAGAVWAPAGHRGPGREPCGRPRRGALRTGPGALRARDPLPLLHRQPANAPSGGDRHPQRPVSAECDPDGRRAAAVLRAHVEEWPPDRGTGGASDDVRGAAGAHAAPDRLHRGQFGARTLEVVGARVLLVPTQKLVGGLEFPERLNHYWCYEANGEDVGVSVTLEDQFSGPDTVRVEQPVLFCNPVVKIHAGERFRIEERQVHLTCYDIHGPQRTEATQFGMTNQLETDTFTVTSWELLCVPSEKLGFQPVS